MGKEIVKMKPINKSNKKKKTTDQYTNELNEKNILIKPLEAYDGANLKILHKCLKCNFEWNVAPSSILQGTGCPECAKNKKSKSKEDFINELNLRHPDIELVSSFTRKSHRMDFKCKKCNTIFNSIGANVLNNKQSCNVCYINPTKMTSEAFKNKFNNKYDTIQIKGEFVDSLTPIEVFCNICKNIWTVIPQHALVSCGCPECARINKIKNIELFLEQLNNKFPNIKLIGDYKGFSTKTKFYCNNCKNEWDVMPNQLLDSMYGCPKCAHKIKAQSLRMSHEEFVEKLKKINPNIKVIGNYSTSQDKIEFLCLKCGNYWFTKPNNILQSKSCPKCNKSHGEQNIEKYLIESNIEYVAQKTYNDLLGIKYKKLSYDFYLPKYNLLIEFQGEQHKKPKEYFGGEEKFKIQQEHDKRKREYAKLHKINLLEIWYYDIDNIEEILTKELFKLNKINNLKLESVETVISI